MNLDVSGCVGQMEKAASTVETADKEREMFSFILEEGFWYKSVTTSWENTTISVRTTQGEDGEEKCLRN